MHIHFSSSHLPYLCIFFNHDGLNMMNRTSLTAQICRVCPPDHYSLYCWALPHEPCVSGALLCHVRVTTSSFLFLLCCFRTVGPLLSAVKTALCMEKPARHLGIRAVEVTEVRKQTKLYWRILTKIKRKT